MFNFEFLFWLLGVHYIGDFALQTKWMSGHKGNNWYVMFAHSFV